MAKPPTERDRYWLEQESRLAASGQTAKAYASERGLSLHALYQARKRLRALGLLAPGKPRRGSKTKPPEPMRFAKVEVVSPRAAAEFRLTLPGGVVLEWSGGALPPAVVDLVERLSAAR